MGYNKDAQLNLFNCKFVDLDDLKRSYIASVWVRLLLDGFQLLRDGLRPYLTSRIVASLKNYKFNVSNDPTGHGWFICMAISWM